MSRSIALIIPSLNSPIIDQVLEHVELQANSDLIDQIWVVGKDDPGVICQNKRTRFLDTQKPVPAGTARNLGLKATRADILIFLDSDCLPQPGWLTGHLSALTIGHQVVGGGILPEGNGYWHLSYNLTLFHEFLSNTQPGPRNYLPTLNLSVKREVINAVGTLDDSLGRGQDIDWTARMREAGYQLHFQPDAVIRHEHVRNTFPAFWSDCARSGYHMRQVRVRHPNYLDAPSILRHRRLILMLSPLIATWITSRIFLRQPAIFGRYWHTLPAIYLSKIAWCWGASRPNPSS